VIPRLPALALRVLSLSLACLVALATLPAQELFPQESQALAKMAAGQNHAAAETLLALAAETASRAGDGEAAACVEAWASQAASLQKDLGTAPPFASFEALRQSPLAMAQPLLRDRIGSVMLDLAESAPEFDTAALADSTGCIPEFWLVGPFDNERGGGYRRSLPPEQHLDLDADLTGKRRAERWRRLPPLPRTRILPLDRIVHPHEQALVYVATTILAADSTPAVLELGTTGSFRVFCNGVEVGSREVERELRRDQDAIVLPLVPGKNLLLLKLCHQEGADFAFTARLRGLDGSHLTTVQTSAEPADLLAAATTTAAPAASTAPAVPLGGRTTWPIAKVTGADALRCAWLWQARAADGDLDRHDLAAARQAVAQLPNLAEVHVLLAAALSTLRRSEADRDDNERRRALEAALALEPQNVRALVQLGQLLLDGSALWRDARTLAEQALTRNPQQGLALLLWRETLAYEGIGDAASARMRGAAAEPTMDLSVLQAVAQEADDYDPKFALQLRRRILDVRVDDDAIEATAALLLRTGQTNAGVDLLAEALARDPFARALRMRLAQYHLATGDPHAALQLVEAWLAIAPDDADAMVFASSCWRRLNGTGDDASGQQLALLRSALEVEPNRRDDERYAEFLAAAATGDAEPFFTTYRSDGAEVIKNDSGALADAAEAHDALHWILRQRVLRANGNGTTNDYLHYVVRVLSEDGARQLANFRLPYWRGEQRARLLSCSIHRPDGQIQRPALRGATVALPNLRPGDVLDVEGRIDDVAPSFFGDYFGLVHRFAADDGSPVRRSELIVLADPGRSYREESVNGAGEPQHDTLADGTERFHWVVENLPRDVPELRRPDRKELDPIARMTTYRDWDHFASWWWNLIKNQIEVTPAMRTTIQQLCAGLTSTDAKIAAIYRFVTTDVRYEAWEFGVHGYKPYSTGVIYERRHGDCKDKALLLCAMLREIDVEARPVLIFGDPLRSKDDLSLAMVQHFNHCIAWLPAADGRPGRFLDGTATWHPTDTLPEMDQGAEVLVVDNGRAELRTVPWTTPQQNRNQDDYTVTLHADGGAEVGVSYRPLGNAAVELRSMVATEPARRREQLERRLTGSLGKLELRDLQSSDGLDLGAPVTISATAALGELGQRSNDRWQLPSTWQYGDLQALASAPERRTPLLLGVPSGARQTVRYRMPPGWRSGELPAAVQKQAAFGSFAMQWRREGDQIVVERTLDFATPRIEPAEYSAFRDFVAAVKAADAQLVLLQKGAGR
jgi:cellulose synthase operon protein C